MLHERGDSSLDWVLADAEAGELFAFGLSEPGNDLVLWDSLTTGRARRRRLRLHRHEDLHLARPGLDPARGVRQADRGRGHRGRPAPGARLPDPRHPGHRDPRRLEHARHARDAEQHDAADRSGRPGCAHLALPPGRPERRPVRLRGVRQLPAADRIGVHRDRRPRSRTGGRGAPPVAARWPDVRWRPEPDIRWRIADAALALDAIGPDIEGLASDVDGLVNHGGLWFRKLTGAKHRATETARVVVDQALRVAGGSGYRADGELARLQRDVLAGIYHPSSTKSVHEVVATTLLGPVEP